MSDSLLPEKLEFFSYVAGLLKLFLLQYQAEKPLIPYPATDLMSLLHSLMELFVKPEVIAKNDTGRKLASLDTRESVNYLPVDKTGRAHETTLQNRVSADAVSFSC